jgi:hypothetical protein
MPDRHSKRRKGQAKQSFAVKCVPKQDGLLPESVWGGVY